MRGSMDEDDTERLQRSEVRHGLVGKGDALKTCNGLPYKVYNSVPVLYLKPFRTTGVPTVTRP
jgi:hypothetical protein